MKRLHEKKQTITLSIAAATYDTEVIIDLINQAIQDNEDFQTNHQKTKLVLSNGKSFFREIPKIMDTQGRTAFQLQHKIKSIRISRELAYLLGFVNHPKHGIPCITMNNSSNMLSYRVIKDLLMVEFFIVIILRSDRVPINWESESTPFANHPCCRKHHFEC